MKYKLWKFTSLTGITQNTVLDFVDDLSIMTTKTTKSIYSNDFKETVMKLKTVDCYMYSADIGKTMCCFMSLAYEPAEFIKNILSTKGILVFYDNIVIMIQFDNVLIISFCGTRRQSLGDWWINITQNYIKEWQQVKPIVINAIQNIKVSNVYICGHSKGGAEALLAYDDLYNIFKSKLKGCYVAGTPDYFLSNIKSVPGAYIIKDKRDPVCFVLSQENFKWQIYLDASGSLSIENHKLISYYDNL